MKKLNRFKDNAENNLRNYEDNCARAQKMFDEYEKIKASFGDKVHAIQADNNKREDALNSYYNSLNELTQVKSQFDFVQSEIEKLKQDSIFFQKEISDFTQEKNNLEAKIPQLEKDKKSFATTRNFKEASRVSNEIKDIQTKLEEVANHLNQKVSMDRATQEKIFLVILLQQTNFSTRSKTSPTSTRRSKTFRKNATKTNITSSSSERPTLELSSNTTTTKSNTKRLASSKARYLS